MLAVERQNNVLDYLKKHKSATIKELAAAVYASEASVRRDVAELEAQGHAERIYGGVLLAKHKNSVVPVGLRDIANAPGKELAAEKAAQLVKDGDTIIMDASTTVFRICHYLKDRKHLKIITNNIRICQEFAQNEGIQVYCTGGAFVPSGDCFLGNYAEIFIGSIFADVLFFSSQGISAQGVITDVGEQEISMRKAMLRQAKKRYFVCDGSKYGIVKPFVLCTKDDVDAVISDEQMEFVK